MSSATSRRLFLFTASSAAVATALGSSRAWASPEVPMEPLLPFFPSQDPELVREVVAVSHADLDRVRELVTGQPELAKAAVDWGFGDWETALGAASHMGRRDIAELLIEHGARPDLFTFAMLGQLEVVKAFVAARPGIQGLRGPHGLSLLHHARMGGEASAPVVRFLEELGDADPSYRNLPLSDEEKSSYVGRFAFGQGPEERLEVLIDRRGSLAVRRGNYAARTLFYQGDHEFHPVGAPSVRLRFALEEGRATGLAICGIQPEVSARRVPGFGAAS